MSESKEPDSVDDSPSSLRIGEILESSREAHRRGGNLAAAVLVLMGLLFVALTFSQGLRDTVAAGFGLERLILFAVGFQFLYIALLLRAKNQLRARFLELLEQILDSFYGKKYRAIDILIRALRGTDPRAIEAAESNLKRLTGQDFGTDAKAWQSWWREHRHEFRPAENRPPQGGLPR